MESYNFLIPVSVLLRLKCKALLILHTLLCSHFINHIKAQHSFSSSIYKRFLNLQCTREISPLLQAEKKKVLEQEQKIPSIVIKKIQWRASSKTFQYFHGIINIFGSVDVIKHKFQFLFILKQLYQAVTLYGCITCILQF